MKTRTYGPWAIGAPIYRESLLSNVLSKLPGTVPLMGCAPWGSPSPRQQGQVAGTKRTRLGKMGEPYAVSLYHASLMHTSEQKTHGVVSISLTLLSAFR